MNIAILAWGGVNDTHLEKLNVVRKWIIKIILIKKSTYPSDKVYTDFGVFDVRQLFTQTLAIEIFKHPNIIKFYDHSYETRSKDFIFLPISYY